MEDNGRESCSPLHNRAQLGREQRHLPVPSPSPIPQRKSKREPSPVRKLPCTAQTPKAVLLWIYPSGGESDSIPVTQGPSQSRSPKEKQAEPAPPAPVHLAYLPQLICQIPNTTSLAVCKQTRRATPAHSES